MSWPIALLLVAWTATAAAEEIAPQRPTGELLQVKPNAYGLGVHADEFGRPLQDSQP
jgi:hypothetical protein